jgi:hypothetical protein
MTAKTSQNLADTLREVGFEDLAKRAEADEFHDFLSKSAVPSMDLDAALVAIIRDEARPAGERYAAKTLRERHHEGEFDADLKESDEWAAGPEGRDAYRRLAEGK